VTHPFTSVPTTLVNTVGVAVTTVGAGFTPARSGARGSTQPAYLSEGDTRVATLCRPIGDLFSSHNVTK
jgi:hypothetical protein